MEPGPEKEVVLTVEKKGHQLWLVATDGPFTIKERLPLHVEKMSDERKSHHIGLIAGHMYKRMATLKAHNGITRH